jgi:hypothetical protein
MPKKISPSIIKTLQVIMTINIGFESAGIKKVRTGLESPNSGFENQ